MSSLSGQELKNFKDSKIKYKVGLLTENTVLMTLLLENLDALEETGLERSNIKKAAKPFRVQMNAFINRVFKVNNNSAASSDAINSACIKIKEVLVEFSGIKNN